MRKTVENRQRKDTTNTGIHMDLQNGVLPPGKDILKYCFRPSKLGENRGSAE